MQMVTSKCAWLKHDRDRAVDEAADFTGCVCNTREGIVSPTWESRRGEAIFTWIPSWGMQRRTVGRSHCKQLQVAQTPPSSTPPRARSQSSRTGLGSADIIVFASATLSGSWESDATGAYCEKERGPNRRSLNITFTMCVCNPLLNSVKQFFGRRACLNQIWVTPLLLFHDSPTSSSSVVSTCIAQARRHAIKTPFLNSWKTYFETYNSSMILRGFLLRYKK